MTHSVNFDVLIVGSGVAGMSLALNLAGRASVAIVTKRSLCDTNTRHAQGGIAAVLDPADSFDAHKADTLVAGAGLCAQEVVELVVAAGPAAIEKLVDRGVALDRGSSGSLELTREGGHSARRIAHAHDLTGAAIQEALAQQIRDHADIEVFEDHLAIDLITGARLARGRGRGVAGSPDDAVLGAYVLDVKGNRVVPFAAPIVVLATGGAGKVYRYTTNPDIATGDGVAMAWRAGARVSNMEFFQFHPTCLYHPKEKSFLISEACRGEGGILRTASGQAFMPSYHALKDLAPRDIVARAIDNELKRSGDECVFLDMTHLPGDFLAERFPNIYGTCKELGIDLRSEPIPVVPAAHYMCGGVQVDTEGQTSIRGLLAIGECTCTGLHGANRLASNSLLEGVVYADRAARRVIALLAQGPAEPHFEVPDWDTGDARNPDEAVVIHHSWEEIRSLMSNYVGIVRTNRRLQRAKRRLELLYNEIREDYWRFYLSPDLIELRNICMVARLVVDCALVRQESRGLHYSTDYPETDDANWRHDTVMRRPRFE